MAGRSNRTYEMTVEIAGRVNRNFSSSVVNAQRQLGGLNSMLKKVGIAVSATAITMGAVNFLKDGVSQAIEYESTMADVAKVVDGLRDKNGRFTESYYEMSDAILEMSKSIPMTVSEMGEITAAAGQAGIANEDLMQFTETAAKMGIAFDTTAGQAGEWMATWRTSFKMSQTEVEALGDQINYLGNTTSENTQKLSGVVTRIGALGKTSGLSAAEIAAMAASMTGVTEEISATGIKNLMLAMTAGEAATDKQQRLLQNLGFSATDMAERMQVDAKGAILDFLGAIKALPEAEQSAALTQFFGKESVAAIAPLLSNLDNLDAQFQKVGDASQYAGSMEAEYATRSDTTANKIQLAKNQINALKIQLGQKFIPVVGAAAEKIGALVDAAPEFVNKYSTVIGVVGAFAGVITAVKLVSFAINIGRVTKALMLQKIATTKSIIETAILQGMYAKDAIVRGASIIATGAHTIAQTAWNFAMAAGAIVAKGFGAAVAFMTSPLGIAIIIIGALIAVGVLLYKNWDTVKAKALELWEATKSVFSGIGDAVKGAFDAAREKIAGFFDWVGEKLSALDEKISSVPVIGSLYRGIKGGIGAIGNAISGGSKVPALASGGVVTAPTLSLIGEGGEPEAVIPLSKLEKILGGASASVGGGVTFAPVIQISGEASKKDVDEALNNAYEKFKGFMARYEKDKRRLAF
ncbi:Phage-related minor tail protein [anaerobic digester metagenome]